MDKLFKILRDNNLKLSSAESFTGGLFANEFTNNEGSSKVFLGSVISYSNQVKENLLGVDPKAIKNNGVVSEVVAKQMAEGANAVIGSDISISFTGNAGDKSWEGSEPGQAFIAVNTPNRTYAKELKLSGTREEKKKQAVNESIKFIIETLESN